jgi:RNA polymerase sigma factor (sigma-70 family)
MRSIAMVKNWQTALSRVKGVLMHRGRTVHDADDLVQEAWLRLACYEGRQTVAEPVAFLMRAALNLSTDGYRATRSRGEQVLFDEEVLVDTSPSVEDIILSHERMDRLAECISRLDARTGELFIAHRIRGMRYEDISREYRLSVSAVEKHIAKATLLVTAWMEGWWP